MSVGGVRGASAPGAPPRLTSYRKAVDGVSSHTNMLRYDGLTLRKRHEMKSDSCVYFMPNYGSNKTLDHTRSKNDMLIGQVLLR